MRLMTILASESALSAPRVYESTLPEAEVIRRRLMRLAFDVHDGPMQNLTAAGWGLRHLRSDLIRCIDAGEAAEAVAARFDLLMAELVSAEAGLRSLISSLERGGSTDFATLEVIAATEIDAFRRRCDATTRVVVPSNVSPDSHSQALAIAGVLREALNNVAKHANADEVLVRLQADHQKILLEIGDDGEGFDPETTKWGIGLTSMRERVHLLQGELEISSAPGGPTVVIACFRRWQPVRLAD